MAKIEPKVPLGFVLVDSLTRLGQDAFRWGAIAFCAWQAQKTVTNLAGKITFADLRFTGTLPESYSDAQHTLVVGITVGGLGLLAGLLGTIYGFNQRRLRLSVVDALGNRNKAIEVERDPKRTSSRLNRKGLVPREER